MTISEWVQIILTGVLVLITGVYAWRTYTISKATEKQAEASVKMTEAASRPVIIPKAMPIDPSSDTFSHFQVRNDGNGSAIELRVFLLDREKRRVDGLRDTSVRAGEHIVATPEQLSFGLAQLTESTYYLVCQYQSVFSQLSKTRTWDEVLLPFKRGTSSQGGVRVDPKKVEIRFDVREEDLSGVTQHD